MPANSPKSNSGSRPLDRRAFFRQLLARGVNQAEKHTHELSQRLQQAIQKAEAPSVPPPVAAPSTPSLQLKPPPGATPRQNQGPCSADSQALPDSTPDQPQP